MTKHTNYQSKIKKTTCSSKAYLNLLKNNVCPHLNDNQLTSNGYFVETSYI